MAVITPREFLRKNGFTIADRGRIPTEQLQFLKENGWDVEVPVATPKIKKTPKPKVVSENAKIREWAKLNSIELNPTSKIPNLIKAAFAANDPSMAVKPDIPVVESESSKIRAWATENGISFNARGKLSTALKDAYAANDPELASKPKEVKESSRRSRKTNDDAEKVLTGWVAKPTISSPIVRDTNEAYAIVTDGLVIAFSTCGHCKEAVSRCACKMPKAVSFVAKLMPEHTVSLTRPEKLRHESLTLPAV